MAKSRMARSSYFFLSLCGLAVLSGVVHGDAGKNGVCDQWTDLANKVSGSGKIHNCTTRANDCTVMDCLGATTFSHNQLPAFLKNDIYISYCFGIEINSCNNPLSMDFYLQVPSNNVSKAYRVVDDEEFAVTELSYSLGLLGTAYPVFNIIFERNADSAVNLSVTGEVKIHTSLGDTPISAFRFHLIDHVAIPVKPCEKIVSDSSKTPPKSFVPEKCQLKVDVPVITANTSTNENASETLNKTCSLEQMICGPREVCDLLLASPKCICKLEFKLSKKGDVCQSSSKLNQACVQRSDCGYNEECRAAGSSKTLTCQCREHYKYNTVMNMCTESQTGDDNATAVTSHPTSSQSNSTIKGASKSDTGSSSAGKHSLPIYIGGAAAAVVVGALVLWGTVRIIRRRRYPHLSVSDRESSASLIGNTDDNLIM